MKNTPQTNSSNSPTTFYCSVVLPPSLTLFLAVPLFLSPSYLSFSLLIFSPCFLCLFRSPLIYSVFSVILPSFVHPFLHVPLSFSPHLLTLFCLCVSHSTLIYSPFSVCFSLILPYLITLFCLCLSHSPLIYSPFSVCVSLILPSYTQPFLFVSSSFSPHLLTLFCLCVSHSSLIYSPFSIEEGFKQKEAKAKVVLKETVEFMLFFQNDRGKIASKARYLPPKQTRRPLSSLCDSV